MPITGETEFFMKLRLSNIFRHLALVTRHRHAVFINCIKCGIPVRGLLHDLSKFSPTEFFESARYYQGNRSPISACRRTTGVSRAWLHHKGRNRHHIEYWQDDDAEKHPLMPYEFAVECVCDKIAATKTYLREAYNNEMPMVHWRTYGSKVRGNERTLAFVERVFTDLSAHGEKFVLNKKYMKRTYAEVCLAEASKEDVAL